MKICSRIVTAIAAVIVMIVASPGLASAAVALSDDVVVTGAAPVDYTFSTNKYYWSLVSVQPQAGDVDLALFVTNGRVPFAASRWGTGATDFVAINSNVGARPFGGYRASIALVNGSSWHAVHFVQGSHVTTLPTPAWNGVSGPSDPDINFAVLSNDEVGSVADIYLTAGQKFWAHTATAANNLYLLESNPGQSATFTRTRSQAALANHAVVDGCTLYTAAHTGWHGLAVVDNRMPTSPGAGIAYALHQWSPSKPTTCPVKNFPASTPA